LTSLVAHAAQTCHEICERQRDNSFLGRLKELVFLKVFFNNDRFCVRSSRISQRSLSRNMSRSVAGATTTVLGGAALQALLVARRKEVGHVRWRRGMHSFSSVVVRVQLSWPYSPTPPQSPRRKTRYPAHNIEPFCVRG
jgi:hypothetical protein